MHIICYLQTWRGVIKLLQLRPKPNVPIEAVPSSPNPEAQARRPCRSPRNCGACGAWRWEEGRCRWGRGGRRLSRRTQTTRSSSIGSRWSRRCRSCASRTVASPPPRWLCTDLMEQRRVLAQIERFKSSIGLFHENNLQNADLYNEYTTWNKYPVD